MTGDSPSAGRHAARGAGRSAMALLLLASAVLACFPRALSPRWVFFSRDIHAYWYPMVSTFVRVVAEGSLPTWDPYEGFGLPLWADPGSQVAYPPTWLNLFLLPHTVYKLVVVGHVIAAGAGVFALLRRWGAGRLPATAAAVTFACSGPLLSAGSLIHHLCGAAWIPWVLWAFEGVLERGSRKTAAVLALVLGAQALAGSAEMCAMAGIAALLRWVTLAAGRWGAAVRRLAPLAAAVGIASLIAAAQWLPTASLVGRTNRMSYSHEARLSWSVHPVTLVDALVPRLVSEMSMGEAVRDVLFDTREPFLVSLYLGAATLPLVLLGLRSGRPQCAWAALSFGCFALVSLGRYFGPARVVLAVPPLSLFRYPSKYVLAATFCWAVLAGLGVEVWWRAWNERDQRYGRAVAAVLVLLAAALGCTAYAAAADGAWLTGAFQVPEPWRAWMALLASWKLRASALWLGGAALLLALRSWRPEWARVSALLVTLVAAWDLTAAGRPVNPLAPAVLLTHRPPLLEALLPAAQRTRLLSLGRSGRDLNRELVRGPAGWEPEWRWALGLQEMIEAPLGARWGLRGSYDADFTGLASPQLTMMSGLVRHAQSSPLGVRLLQMGNVGWVIDPGPDGFPPLPEAVRAPSVFAHPLRLLRVPDPMPPCYVVGAATPFPSDDEAVRRIASADFDPSRAVVLAEGASLDAAAGFEGTARYRLRQASRLEVETETTGPGVLVLSEAFDVGWRATVDGAPAAVERANVLFRAVRVPAGRHVVAMTYLPLSIRWGLGAASLGVVLAAALLARGRA